jgi:hypothetical protein
MSYSLKSLTQHQERFVAFLNANGAEVLTPTNEWEVVRFNTGEGVSIIYKTARGELTFTGEASNAFNAFKKSAPWRAMPRTGKKKKSTARLQAIRERDGGFCFFCQKPVPVDEESEEHLVAMTHGGPNHISNLFLAHRICNANAGHLSAAEKIEMHVEAILKDSKFL